MTYLIFGWSEGTDSQGPADEFLGTYHEISPIEPQEYETDGKGVTKFGHKYVEEDVELAPSLLRGKTYRMTVLKSWGVSGIENAGRIVAYMKVVPSG